MNEEQVSQIMSLLDRAEDIRANGGVYTPEELIQGMELATTCINDLLGRIGELEAENNKWRDRFEDLFSVDQDVVNQLQTCIAKLKEVLTELA